MHSYADPGDLAGPPWNLTLAVSEADDLLQRASVKIRKLTITAIYRTNPDGTPTDPNVRDALRDATCAQAAWLDETGDTGSGATGRFNSMSLGSASLSGGGTGSPTNTSAATGSLSPEAVQILQNAGLLGQAPRSW